MTKFALSAVLCFLAFGLVGQAQADQLLRCQSIGNRYNFCPTNTYGGISLVDEFSDAPCVYGRSWGYTSRGIWVDNGCRAMFNVRQNRIYYDSRDYRPIGAVANFPTYRNDDRRYMPRPFWAPPGNRWCHDRSCASYNPPPRTRPDVRCAHGHDRHGRCRPHDNGRGRAK
ncbi:MAG TPA: DUF3011 domain-containing protein [Oligoflexia bacterium]|nr:DUF3011 domain-containing protein [Oligoflexia bacterium]